MTPREKAIEWAISVAYDPRAVVLDTETLGIKPDAGLCDIAVVAIDGTVVFDSLINPERPIPREASDIHGIRNEDVRNAPTFHDIYADLRAVLSGRTVIVYNAGFDAAVIDACCDTYDLPALGGANWHCAMKAYSDFDGTMQSRRVFRYGRPTFERSAKWHKLSEACNAMGVTLDGAHRALADADATRRLVLAMAGAATPKPEATPMQMALLRRG